MAKANMSYFFTREGLVFSMLLFLTFTCYPVRLQVYAGA